MPVLLLPDTIDLPLGDIGQRRIVVYDAQQATFPPAAVDADVMVAWQNSAVNLRAATMLPNLRLVQTLAAGPDAVSGAGFANAVALCSGRSLHDAPVAEHVLALLLSVVRRLGDLAASQRAHRWDDDYRRAQQDPATTRMFTLDGARVAVLGYGSIARRLAPMLTSLGAQVVGVARSAGDHDGVPVHAFSDVERVVSEADAVISLLPSSPHTDRLIGAEILARFRPEAVFVNAGRGSTVDEEALRIALSEGRLRAAALDVMETEPLPIDSPLWETPNLLLTPHVAGNRPRGGGALVTRNVQHLDRHEPLENRVDERHQNS